MIPDFIPLDMTIVSLIGETAIPGLSGLMSLSC
jgi:hypothetical protein